MSTSKILLSIDDEESISKVIQVALEMMAGWTVLIANSGVEGITMAETQKPDAILLDVEMPVVDGLKTLHRLQENPLTQNIPVVFLTCWPHFVNQGELGKLGVKAVIEKPFDPLTLANLLECTLNGFW
ncbi:MAG: response regulator [Leptolyngbyaceae cyanobacterium MO_188.B28]|nr:response regulator [Leptolyngbyaceae cyanobacterium MO_188.B28]